MAYGKFYDQWIDATYDTSGKLITPSPTPFTAAVAEWWDAALADALPQVAKGDLVAYTGSDTAAVPVGADGMVLTADSTQTAGMRWVTPLAPTVPASVKTANYVLALGDMNTAIEMNVSTANTVTVPPHSSVGFPVGAVIEVVQYGAGQTTIVAGAGVSLRSSAALTARGQYSTISLRQRATDEWIVAGDLT